VAGRRHLCRTQRLYESNQGGHLLRRQILAIGWYVASALNHLPNQLVVVETRAHIIERWAAQAPPAPQTVTIPALLVLQHQRTLQFQWRTPLHIPHWRGIAAPGFHVGRPGGIGSQLRQRTECEEHEEHA